MVFLLPSLPISPNLKDNMNPTNFIQINPPNLSSTMNYSNDTGYDLSTDTNNHNPKEYLHLKLATITELMLTLQNGNLSEDETRLPLEHCIDILTRWGPMFRPTSDLRHMTAWIANLKTKRYMKGTILGKLKNNKIAIRLQPDHHHDYEEDIALNLPTSTTKIELYFLTETESETDTLPDWRSASLKALLDAYEQIKEAERISPIPPPEHTSTSGDSSDGTTGKRIAHHMIDKIKSMAQPWCKIDDLRSDNDTEHLEIRINKRIHRKTKKMKKVTHLYNPPSSDSDDSSAPRGYARGYYDDIPRSQLELLDIATNNIETNIKLKKNYPKLVTRKPDSLTCSNSFDILKQLGISNPTQHQMAVARLGDTEINNQEPFEIIMLEIERKFTVCHALILASTGFTKTLTNKFFDQPKTIMKDLNATLRPVFRYAYRSKKQMLEWTERQFERYHDEWNGDDFLSHIPLMVNNLLIETHKIAHLANQIDVATAKLDSPQTIKQTIIDQTQEIISHLTPGEGTTLFNILEDVCWSLATLQSGIHFLKDHFSSLKTEPSLPETSDDTQNLSLTQLEGEWKLSLIHI